MDILLWRLADTKSGMEELSERGQKQTKRMAHWLRAQMLKTFHVYAMRGAAAEEMATAFGGGKVLVKSLGREPRPLDVLAATGWPEGEGTALIIAPREALEPLAALLLTGTEMPVTIKKGGLWWFTHRRRADERQIVLRAVITPDLLRD
jgi:phosphohistidine phosphatase